eukprot:TRINITY_DN15113_c0_g1_i1.p1 TRINITY_DN15113_c0_g1~~TRINITY_DN15113_c0_g1_i1.p1  ORF type:complete len:327 (+),score=30.55 TRINITY_DN15113_c0_g1_i1:75-983(+)
MDYPEALQPYLHIPHVQALLAEQDMIDEDPLPALPGDEFVLLWAWLCKYWKRGREEGFRKTVQASLGKMCARRRRDPRLLSSDVVIHWSLPFLEVPEICLLSRTAPSIHRATSSTDFVGITAKARGVDMSRLNTLAHVHVEDEVNRLENIIAFNFSTTFLHDRFKPTLKRIAKLAAVHPASKVVVETHVDPTGDLQSARHFSRVRGTVVLSEMKSYGLEERRVELRTGCLLPEIDRPRSDREHRRVDIYMEMDGIQFPAKKKEPSPVLLATMQRLDGASEADLGPLLQTLLREAAGRPHLSM